MDSLIIGNRLKQRREEKKYTLKELADRSELSVGFISQVERGKTDPSLASLKRLSAALDLKLKELFDTDGCSRVLVKRGEGALLQVRGASCELLAPAVPDKQMEPLLKHIAPGSESGPVSGHAGDEFIWIKAGSLQVTVGEETYLLQEGDSLYFQALQTHSWRNDTARPCEALWIMTPPSYS